MIRHDDERVKSLERALIDAYRSERNVSQPIDVTTDVMRHIRRSSTERSRWMPATVLDQLVWRTATITAAVVLTAIFQPTVTIPMAQVQRAERQLIGVQMYQREDFEKTIELLEEKKLDLSGIVTHELPLAQTAEAFQLLESADAAAGKVLIRVKK